MRRLKKGLHNCKSLCHNGSTRRKLGAVWNPLTDRFQTWSASCSGVLSPVPTELEAGHFCLEMVMKREQIPLGLQFGRWTNISGKYTAGKDCVVDCRCSCGTLKTVNWENLKRGKTKSCGCLANELAKTRCVTHGMSKEPIYAVWNMMLQRCNLSTNKQYADYGGRGVKVCEEWHKFENFYADMGNPPFKGASLDRKDNNLGYNKENCRWADRDTQNNNTRKTSKFEYEGKLYTLKELSEISGIKTATLSSRIYAYKWTVKAAVEHRVMKPEESSKFDPSHLLGQTLIYKPNAI